MVDNNFARYWLQWSFLEITRKFLKNMEADILDVSWKMFHYCIFFPLPALESTCIASWIQSINNQQWFKPHQKKVQSVRYLIKIRCPGNQHTVPCLKFDHVVEQHEDSILKSAPDWLKKRCRTQNISLLSWFLGDGKSVCRLQVLRSLVKRTVLKWHMFNSERLIFGLHGSRCLQQ